MTEYRLNASVRQKAGKGYSKSLYQRGLIPAVVYGKTVGSMSLEVNEKEVLDAVRLGKNTIINLTVPGNGGPYKVMVRDLQCDSIKRVIRHVDFQEISLKDRIHTTVPVNLSGEAAGGLARLSLRNLEILCLPAKIPSQVTVDITGMNPGDSVAVRDLRLPVEVKVLTAPDINVVTVLSPEEEALSAPAKEANGGQNGKETEKANLES